LVKAIAGRPWDNLSVMDRPKRPRPAPAQGVAIFPEQLRIGDRFTNADGEWEVVPLTFRALGWRRES